MLRRSLQRVVPLLRSQQPQSRSVAIPWNKPQQLSRLEHLATTTLPTPTDAQEPQVEVVFISKEQLTGLLEGQSVSLAGDSPVKSAVTQVLRAHGYKTAPGAEAAPFHNFFDAAKGSSATLFAPSGEGDSKRFLFVGLGEDEKVDVATLRTVADVAIKSLRKDKLQHALLQLPDVTIAECDRADIVYHLQNTCVLSNHAFDKYLTKEENKKHYVDSIAMSFAEEEDEKMRNIVLRAKHGKIIAQSAILARELAAERADVATPDYVEALARKMADQHVLKCEVIKGDELVQLGYNMIRAVGQGASKGKEPRIITLSHHGIPGRRETHVSLVGKGLCFDSGGLNLKPTKHIEDMHMDKAGMAAVLGVIKAVACMRIPINITATLALAENAIGPDAYKPHAIIQAANDKTVEVANTDAEGRLVLADAMLHVQNMYQPHMMIDVATLTGSCVHALGESTAGLFSNNDEMCESLSKAADYTGEKVWRMPLWEEHSELLKGEEADLRSCSNGPPGAIAAAAFLKEFVDDDVKWAHLDVAGPAMLSKANGHQPKGATGFGVHLLANFVQTYAKTVPMVKVKIPVMSPGSTHVKLTTHE